MPEIETWKEIVGYDSIYLVSDHGRVKSQIKMFKIQNSNGYRIVALKLNGKYQSRYVHRLVAICFLTNPNNYNEVNHKDGNKANNQVENLEWTTRSLNNKHAYNIGLHVAYDRSGDKNPKFRHGKKVQVNDKRSCLFCSRPFIAKYASTNFCSLPCVAKYNSLKIKEKRDDKRKSSVSNDEAHGVD